MSTVSVPSPEPSQNRQLHWIFGMSAAALVLHVLAAAFLLGWDMLAAVLGQFAFITMFVWHMVVTGRVAVGVMRFGDDQSPASLVVAWMWLIGVLVAGFSLMLFLMSFNGHGPAARFPAAFDATAAALLLVALCFVIGAIAVARKHRPS
jgi:hypothetical protein